MFGMLFAKEKRTQLGSPKASPITEDTFAVFNKYILKSGHWQLFVSSDFDNRANIQGKIKCPVGKHLNQEIITRQSFSRLCNLGHSIEGLKYYKAVTAAFW